MAAFLIVGPGVAWLVYRLMERRDAAVRMGLVDSHDAHGIDEPVSGGDQR